MLIAYSVINNKCDYTQLLKCFINNYYNYVNKCYYNLIIIIIVNY